jgi:hypothetical protein
MDLSLVHWPSPLEPATDARALNQVPVCICSGIRVCIRHGKTLKPSVISSNATDSKVLKKN